MLYALILYMSGGTDLQFNVVSERQIFEKIFSWQVYLFSEFLPEMAEEILVVFRLNVWPGIRAQVLRLITQHTTY